MTDHKDPITLYGAAQSLYSGRARSYLIKAGIPYREKTPTDAHYTDTVLPKAGGRKSLPTIETPDGEVVRDGAAIIDHFEAESDHRFSPKTPKQNLFSRLLDAIGAEGLLRPAMHYRWNFPDENLALINFHFITLMPPGPGREEIAMKVADQMRAGGQAVGVVPETYDIIAAHYGDVMQSLDVHFAEHPYLLGGRPCIGDFGLIAPLYGHLGRDPKPLAMMMQNAVRLYRWVERMNRPDPDIGEFEDYTETYLSDDEIPSTLIAALKVLAEDFVPETEAAATCINDWLGEHAPAAGTPVERAVGFCAFDVRGTLINAAAQPYRFYLLKRAQDAYRALSPEDRRDADALLSACNMRALMDTKIDRDIGRDNNLEVWI